jgi:hypothetical protein
MFNVPENYRVPRGPFASKLSDGNNGFFVLPAPKGSLRTHIQCLASDQLDWEHVSISVIYISHKGKSQPVPRCPTWEEMCYIKETFWDNPEDCVIQFHPPASEYVNNHEFCLHLWRQKDTNVPTPPKELVGFIPPKKEEQEIIDQIASPQPDSTDETKS